jgi:hypothetical protein
MKRLLVSVTAAVMLVAAPPAFSSPITYELSGASETFSQGLDNISGTFTFDPSTSILSAIDVTVSGALGVGTYDVPLNVYMPYATDPVGFQASSADASLLIVIPFLDPLTSAPDPIDFTPGGGIGICITALPCGGYEFYNPLSWAGAADPITTPIPAALPLFATGLGAMGLLGWRRKRKAQAAAA